jgi:type VI secretion system protein ImpM
MHEPPGWFGKVAMLGDFAHRRLPAAVVQRWDEWLSQGIATSRRDLGDGWLDVYLTAPLWCFVCAPRVLDEAWWFGVMMPSVDAVGRYFPLVICHDADQAPADGAALSQLSAWYASTGDCALATLQPRSTLEQFEGRLVGIAAAQDDPGAAPAIGSDAGEICFDVSDPARWLSDAPAIALRAALAGLTGQTLWWPLSAAQAGARVRVVAGLPSAQRFTAMLRGCL